ncbi:hypothetical protein AAKU67_002262 [Oxalobacteraceae bacterium GrIS 2.11]
MSLRYISISWLFLLLLFAGNASADSFEKALMPGELTHAHAKYENDCSHCHAKFDKTLQMGLCLDCHKEIAADLNAKSRMHGHLDDKTCRTCHTEHKGRNAELAILDKSGFNHNSTNFPLKDAHKPVKCASCHIGKIKYRDAPKLCNDCHKKDDQEKGHKGSLGKQCESCHSEKSWKDSSFDHEKTKFALKGGKHMDVKCADCHVNKIYNTAPTECIGCHKKADQEKGHKGRYSGKCESCHTDKGWKEIRFNHDTDTHYALRGKHHQLKCDSCHLPELGQIYQHKLPEKCVACHKKDDQEKGHKGELGEQCANCHDERGWRSSNFNHDSTHFPLHDKHREAKCDACHKGGVSGARPNLKLETACVACHRKDDMDKGHKGRYGDKCDSCHTEKNWTAGKFDHARDTSYVLKGKHALVKCDACHVPEKGALYQKVKLDHECAACHLKDDKHKQQLGKQCASCHNEKTWKDAPYDHNKSRFPLTGSHARTPCKDCHQTPAFHDTASTCYSCHEKEDKHHKAYGIECQTCHYTGTWKSWDFDHNKTRFALDGAHVSVNCDDCHHTQQIQQHRISKTCFSCHRVDDVHHGGFGAQCEHCHTTSKWKTMRR